MYKMLLKNQGFVENKQIIVKAHEFAMKESLQKD